MSFLNEENARTAGEVAKRSLPPGWELDVRASAGGGYHFVLCHGPVSVYFSTELNKFWAMVARDADVRGTGGCWGTGSTARGADTPAEAIKLEVARYVEHRDAERARFARLDAAINDLPVPDAARFWARKTAANLDVS